MSGVVATSAAGSVGHGGVLRELTGQEITSGQGLFDNPHGVVTFSGQGSLSPVNNPTGISGQSITSAQGTLTPVQVGDDVTVNINAGEMEVVIAAGEVSPKTFPSGQASTSAAGTIVVSRELPLTGSAITSAINNLVSNQDADDTRIISSSGTAAPDCSKALVGSLITGSQGTVTTSDKESALNTGPIFRINSNPGTVVPNLSFALTGIALTCAQSNVGAPGFADLSGSSVSVEQGFFGRVYPLSGQEITGAQGTIIGLPGIVDLVGEGVSVQQGTLTPSGTQWDPKADPTTAWTRAPDNAAVWTRKPGVTTTWNRKT
jgi:hypothetical protein